MFIIACSQSEGYMLGAAGDIMSKTSSCFQGAITTHKIEAVQWVALGSEGESRQGQKKLWH